MLITALNEIPTGVWFMTKDIALAMQRLGYEPGKTDKTRASLVKQLQSLAKRGFLTMYKPHTRLYWRRIKEIS